MKLVHRRPASGSTDAELVFGVLFLPLTGVASLVLAWVPAAWLPRCMLHAFFGVPCPTCGACRSLALLARGRVPDAWRMQPLIVTLVICGLLYSLYSLVVVLGRLPRLRIVEVSRKQKRFLWSAALLIVLLNWLYLGWYGI